MRKIKLVQGQSIEINGYRITAIGPNEDQGLQIAHPSAFTEKSEPENHLYAGLCNNIVIESTLAIGRVGDLVESGGWKGAIQRAKNYLKRKRES